MTRVPKLYGVAIAARSAHALGTVWPCLAKVGQAVRSGMSFDQCTQRCPTGVRRRLSRGCTVSGVQGCTVSVARCPRSPDLGHRLRQPWRGHCGPRGLVMRLREPDRGPQCQPERWRRIPQGLITLIGFVARSPVGVLRPDPAHPRPLAVGITGSFAVEQPLRHRLRRCGLLAEPAPARSCTVP